MYGWDATVSQLNLLDSHDTARFLSVARDDQSAYRLAVLFSMTFPGAPCIYYGDEIGMTGEHAIEARATFPWDQSRWNRELRDYVKKAISLRHTHSVLRRGGYASLRAADGTYVFSRSSGHDLAVIAFNTASHDQRLAVDLPEGYASPDLTSVWGSGNPTIAGGRIDDWQLPARNGDVLIGRVSRD
jgi:neopullulanase